MPSTCQRLQASTALAIAICFALPGCEWLSPTQPSAVEDGGTRTIYSLGRLEPASGIIDIRATPGDGLQELYSIEENELAPEDGILGRLSSYDMGRAQLVSLIKKRDLADQKHLQQVQLAQAQLAQAKASKAQAEAKKAELELQQGKLGALKVSRDLSAKEYQKLEHLRLSDPELVTQHQLDKQKNQMDLASQDYNIAYGRLISASHAADLAVIAADANIKVANTAVQQATKNYEKLVVEQEIEVAQEALKRSILLAPNVSAIALSKILNEDLDNHDASNDIEVTEEESIEQPRFTVLKVFLRRGEVVTQAPIMQLGDLRKMICIAEVYEADIKELREGQTVTLRSPAFSGIYADGKIDPETQKRSGGIRGHVVRIGRLVASPGLSNRNPLAPADRSIVEVRIEIDEPDSAGSRSETPTQHAAKHVGMQVTVEFGKSASDDDNQATDRPTGGSAIQ